MTPDDLRRIAEAATEGPWEARTDDADMIHVVRDSEYVSYVCTVGGKEAPNAEADAEFMETFNPQRVLEMIDTLRGAEIRLDHAKTVIDRLQTRLAAVEKLHQPLTDPGLNKPHCAGCETGATFRYWPCDTIKAARGE